MGVGRERCSNSRGCVGCGLSARARSRVTQRKMLVQFPELAFVAVGDGRRHTSDSDNDGSESIASSEENFGQFESSRAMGLLCSQGTTGAEKRTKRILSRRTKIKKLRQEQEFVRFAGLRLAVVTTSF